MSTKNKFSAVCEIVVGRKYIHFSIVKSSAKKTKSDNREKEASISDFLKGE